MKLTKILIGIPTLWYGLVPPIIDFSTSHVLNPNWIGHARFHMVWLLILKMFLSFFCLVLIIKKIPNEIVGLRIAGLISLSVYISFFISTISMNLYGGTLSDDNGIAPMFGINTNVLVFIPLTILLLIGVYRSFYLPVNKEVVSK